MNISTIFDHFKEYKAVLFDLDGVLINSDQGWIIAIQKVLAIEGLNIPQVRLIEKI